MTSEEPGFYGATISQSALQSEPYRPRSVTNDVDTDDGEEREGREGGTSQTCILEWSNKTEKKQNNKNNRLPPKRGSCRIFRSPKGMSVKREEKMSKLSGTSRRVDYSTASDNNQTENRGCEGGERAGPHWVVMMEGKPGHKPSCCIYRVPQAFHDGNKKLYVPQLVSIGPFHHGEGSLQRMEEYKRWYLQFLLPQNRSFMRIELLDIIKNWEKEAREFYSETIDLDSNAFAEMMLLDCCFLIALFWKNKGELIQDKNDPIFKMRWVMLALWRDLLMLENQVPLFILRDLFDHISNRVAYIGYIGSTLYELALQFFDDCKPHEYMELKHDQNDEPLHLLHLYYTSLIPEKLRKKSKDDFPDVQRINSMTKLQDAGLKLKKCEAKSFLDIRFNKHQGILEIPTLQVEDFTSSQLPNLIAFEQCYHGVPTLITAYALFMDCLIDSPEDVGILRQDGIIDSWLGNDEQVANLFNKLCRDVVIENKGCYLSNVFSEVNVYCGKTWPKKREELIRKYFRSPWTTISLIGAIFLLILTIAQTIITFVAYFVPPRP